MTIVFCGGKEWHFFSDANYADLVWPLVTDFLQRTV